jgi:hypothetical protein
VTDRQRIEAEMGKPMSGGDKPPPAGGLFDADARAQGDLLGLQGGTGQRADLDPLAQRKGGGGLYNEQERPDLGVPGGPSPAKELSIRSLQQMSMDLAAALDMPLRQGRVQMRGALGTYSRRSGVVRVREVPDFDVVSHEAGHAIEEQGRRGPDGADRCDHAVELRPLDYDQTQDRPAGERGLCRVRPADDDQPGLCPANAGADVRHGVPVVHAAREPEMLAKIDSAAVAYKAYLDAPSVDAVGSVRRSETKTRRARQGDGGDQGRRPAGGDQVGDAEVYDAIMDDKAPFARAVRELGVAIRDRTGAPVPLKAADNPEVLQRMLARSRQAAVRDLMDGVRPLPEKSRRRGRRWPMRSERDDRRALGVGKWDAAKKADASTYLIARRAEYLWRKFDAGEIPNPPVAFSGATPHGDARPRSDLPNFRTDRTWSTSTTSSFCASIRGRPDHRRPVQRLSKEEFYVPFMRDMSDRPMAGTARGQGQRGAGHDADRARLRGSSRDIKDPIESIMMQTFMVNRTLRHNDVIKAFVGSREAGGPGGRQVRRADPAPRGAQVHRRPGAGDREPGQGNRHGPRRRRASSRRWASTARIR